MNDDRAKYDKLRNAKYQFDNAQEFELYSYANNFIEIIDVNVPDECIVNHGTEYESDSKYEIKEKEMEKAELEKKLASLDAAVADLEKKVRAGGGAGTAMEYSVEVVEHNKASEVNVEALSKLLKKKSSEGWTLISVVDDDGGKLISSMGGGSDSGLSSLAASPFSQKEDRLVLIFGKPAV